MKMERLIYLSWKLIECKLAYYRPDLVRPKFIKTLTITDQEYDQLEIEYIELCKHFDKEPSATRMVGFDVTRPACRLVISKYGK